MSSGEASQIDDWDVGDRDAQRRWLVAAGVLMLGGWIGFGASGNWRWFIVVAIATAWILLVANSWERRQ